MTTVVVTVVTRAAPSMEAVGVASALPVDTTTGTEVLSSVGVEEHQHGRRRSISST